LSNQSSRSNEIDCFSCWW